MLASRGAPLALAGLAVATWLSIGPVSVTSSSLIATAAQNQLVGAAALAHWRLLETARLLPTDAFPQSLDADGNWVTTGPGGWTCGFLPGSLWLSYEQTLDPAVLSAAQARLQPLLSQETNTTTHDLGFMMDNSFGNAYRLTGNDTYRQAVVSAARSLATRYSPIVGAIRAWNDPTDFLVIVDTMVNAELLLWAADHGGDPAWRSMAIQHGLTTARLLVHADGSVIHQARLDPSTGALRTVTNAWTGLPDSATWARGASWAMHGYTALYARTRDPRFLAVVRSLADHFVAHVPDNDVSQVWLETPPGGSRPDSSATAVASAALGRLATLDPDAGRRAGYAAAARRYLAVLTSPAFLDTTAGGAALLRHGSVGLVDAGTSWGDYYLLEAIERHRLLPPASPPLALTGATASSNDGNVPANVLDGDVATRWSAYGSGQWLQVVLATPQPVHAVSVTWLAGAARSARFRIDTWTSTRGWIPAVTAATTGWSAGEETYDLRPRAAAAVRITGFGSTQSLWTSINEVRVR